MELGKQQGGSSHGSIKQMAFRALDTLPKQQFMSFVDIGSGSGAFANQLADRVQQGYLLDADPPAAIPHHYTGIACDLNLAWPIPDNSAQLAVALEVIEHLENPRHFFRELHRILEQKGYAFISTPHNLNLMARILFLTNGQHRFFQDYSYPAHITPLLPVDFRRIAKETGFTILSVHYNHFDIWPIFKKPIGIRHRLFSNSIGFLMQKA